MQLFITAIIVLMGLTGCAATKSALQPMSWVLEQYPKDAPPDYVEGWQHGCESGLAAMTNDFYRTFYKFKSDETQIKNPNYYKPWKDAYNYCRHYAYGPLREGGLRQKLPNQDSNDILNKPFDNPFSTIFMQRLWSGEGSDNW